METDSEIDTRQKKGGKEGRGDRSEGGMEQEKA